MGENKYTWGQKFRILTLISLSLKKKKNSKNLCLVKFEVLGYKNTQKIIAYHIHIRSTDQFKQVGVRETKMTEMRSIAVEGHHVWLCICVLTGLTLFFIMGRG